MALTSPHPSATPDDPSDDTPADPADDRGEGDDRTMIDLQFEVREHIAELLSRPTFARLRATLDAVGHYLDEEQRRVLDAPVELARLAVDVPALVQGRRALREALDDLRLHALDHELARHTEALRHAFLAHAAAYSPRRPARPSAN